MFKSLVPEATFSISHFIFDCTIEPFLPYCKNKFKYKLFQILQKKKKKTLKVQKTQEVITHTWSWAVVFRWNGGNTANILNISVFSMLNDDLTPSVEIKPKSL